MAVLKRWRTHSGENLAGKAVTWTVRKYVFRGRCSRSEWSGKNIRPIVIQDDSGFYRAGMRNTRSDKPHLHEVGFTKQCFSDPAAATVAAIHLHRFEALWHQYSAEEAHTFKAPQKSEKQRNVIRMRR